VNRVYDAYGPQVHGLIKAGQSYVIDDWIFGQDLKLAKGYFQFYLDLMLHD
jgi:hypothetical protein